MARLAAEKNAFIWEVQTSKRVSSVNVDEKKKTVLLDDLRNSLRVSSFVKEMSDDDSLE